MSNNSTPFGLRPVRYRNGASWNGATQRCFIHADYGTALYIGDIVVLTAATDDQDTTAHHISVKKGDVTSAAIYGVIASFDHKPTSLETVYSPASTEAYANVVTDPNVIFQIKDDGSGTPSKLYPGQNCDMADAGGSTVTGLSGISMAASTILDTQALNLHILGLSDFVGNDLADYAVWDVIINTMLNATGSRLVVIAS